MSDPIPAFHDLAGTHYVDREGESGRRADCACGDSFTAWNDEGAVGAWRRHREAEAAAAWVEVPASAVRAGMELANEGVVLAALPDDGRGNTRLLVAGDTYQSMPAGRVLVVRRPPAEGEAT